MAERYKVYDQLGAGGVGAVYRAYDNELKRWVAIKRLMSSADAGGDAKLAAELRREADALASLRNPNIVTIFDVSSDGEGLFMVMELLEGEDLADVVGRGPLHYDDFKELASQTLEALLAAHQRHILHRDIKPENIKVERLPGGRMQSKIIDFGLARAGLRARKQTEDVTGSVMGSVFYMAPEQLTREPVDERTDLYSLGAVFYEALSGRKAFDGDTLAVVIDKHLNHDILPLHVVAPHVPPWLGAWVLRLMALKPEDRPVNAQQAIEEFRAWEKMASAPPMMPWMPMGYGYSPPVQPGTGQVYPGTAPAPVQTGYVQPVLEVIPTAQPVVEVAARTSAITGADTARQVVRPGGNRSSALARPAQKSASAACGSPPDKKKLFIAIGAGVAVLLLAFFLFGGSSGEDDRPDTAAKSAPVPPPSAGSSKILFQLPESRVFPPLSDDIVMHYIATTGVSSGRKGSDGKPALVAVNSQASAWHDLAARGDDNVLETPDRKPAAGIRRVTWTTGDGFSGIKDGRNALNFTSEGGKDAVLAFEAPGSKAAHMPFGQAARKGDAGLTLVLVFQAQAAALPMRVLALEADKDNALLLGVNSQRQITAEFRAGGRSETLAAPHLNATRPCAVLIAWNADGTILLRAREAAGRGVSVEKKGHSAPGKALKGLRIGGGEQGASTFQGLLGELIVYASALKQDQAQLVAGSQIPGFYFKGTTPPNLPKVTALTERLSIKKPRVGPRTDWAVNTSHLPEDAWLAIDGNTATRWRTDTPQKSGQWFQVTLKEDREISGLALDVSCSPDEHPRRYEVETSLDGKSWSRAASGDNDKPLLEIAFPQPVKTRHVRVKQTGGAPSAHWSIAELEVFAK
ncbi:MAG TPA: hypothetical protein DIT64_20105 [Verrucomicrobiales bacterium]|nr:hypothetical protein [Verrucomicrobiales bacterium]